MKMRIASLSLLTILCLALSAPAFADLYNNGPTNGTYGAWLIGVGNYVVSDSFVPNASGNMMSFDIALWVESGYTPLTVDWAVGTSSFGSDVASGSGSWTSLTLLCSNGQPFNGGICSGGSGYDIYDTNMSVGNLPVTAGNTYWLTLTSATDSKPGGGNPAWDENFGPSLAYNLAEGSIPSESFTINGGTTTPELSSIMLFGSGILGIAGVLRRKLKT